MNKYTAEEIRNANQYIGFGIKEGFINEDDVKGMTSEELVEYADDQMARGDAEAESALEREAERQQEYERR